MTDYQSIGGPVLERASEPAALLTLSEAKAHLRVDHADEDALITAFVASASASLDGPSGEYGFPIASQRWSVKVRVVTGVLELPLLPVISLFSIKYYPADGGAQVTATLSDYRLVATSIWAYVEPVSGVWPELADRHDALEVVWTAGFADIPADVKHTARLLVGDYYANREAQVMGSISVNPAIERLVALRRRLWLSA
jgi:uncharacterized phiE125 gp8 family phage protein